MSPPITTNDAESIDELNLTEESVLSADLQPLSLYSNNGLSEFSACNRLYYLTHTLGWRKTGKSPALGFGSSWHSAMDTIWQGYETIRTGDKKPINALIEQAYESFIATWVECGFTHPDELSPDELEDLGARTPHTAHEMLFNYVDARNNLFCDPSFKLLSVERPFAVPLSPTDPTLFYCGRLDKEISWRGRVLIIEHKTTTLYKKSGYFRNDFVDAWSPSSQVDGYSYEGHMTHGDKFGGVWIDGALVHKTVHEGFIIIPVEKQLASLESWLWTAHNTINQIKGNLAALKNPAVTEGNYMAAFPMNTTSCLRYGRCQMCDVCSVMPNPAKLTQPPLGFKVERHSMFEALKLEQLGFKLAG